MDTTDNQPKVSIIIPVYNVEKYLHECLDSVLGQTLADIEVICVNDGSTDGSLAIIEEYAQKDSRIKVISKPNSGYGHTMNCGLDLAAGEYIGIVESDDYVARNMYEKLYRIARRHDLDFVKADFYRFAREQGKLILEYNDLTYGKKQYYNKVLDPAENTEIFRFIMNTWSGIYKKDFLDRYQIRHNETPGASFQDNGFFFQTFCRAKRAYFVNRPFYMNRRDNPGSSVKNKAKVFCIRDEYQFIGKFLNSDPELKERFTGVFLLKKYHNYLFTLTRIADEFKKMFLEHFSEEFGRSLESGELDRSAFTNDEWSQLNKIITDPAAFYEESLLPQAAKEKQNHLRTLIHNLKHCGWRITTAKILGRFGIKLI